MAWTITPRGHPPHKSLEKGLIENHLKNQKHADDSIIKIGQNIMKSNGDQRRLAVTQTLMKEHQTILVLKTHKK